MLDAVIDMLAERGALMRRLYDIYLAELREEGLLP